MNPRIRLYFAALAAGALSSALQAQAIRPSPAAPEPADEIVELSPFVVTTRASQDGAVTESTSGTLVSRPLDKLPMGIQVVSAELMKQLESILTNAQVEEISFEGSKMTRMKAIEILSDRAFGGGQPASAAEGKQAAKETRANINLEGAIGDLEGMLGASSLLDALKGVLGLESNKKN